MYQKYWIGLFATSFAIIFTALAYVMPDYAKMWLSIEVIVLPIIYYMGYEVLMSKQRSRFEKDLRVMHGSVTYLKDHAINLEKELKLEKEKNVKLKNTKNIKNKNG